MSRSRLPRVTHYPARITRYASGQNLFLAAALLIACAAAWPLLAEPGLLNTRGGGDSPFLLQRLHQLETALRDGHFPVRWMPDANYGYGYPFYNYYAPLSIYITAVFRFSGFSYVRAIQLAQLLGFITAAWGMFHLGQRYLKSDTAGFLAAVAYTVAPFHMVNVYVRGDSLAEFWAMAFYPLTILAAGAAVRQPSPSKIAWLALSYAALILSHNISALIFSPFLLLYILLHAWSRPRRVAPGAAFFALLLGLGLAAWFFVPALGEQSLAQLEPVTQGYFHYSAHFRGQDLVQPSFWFDYNPDGRRAFSMGLVQTVTAVLGFVALFIFGWHRRASSAKDAAYFRAFPLFIAMTFIVATLMITPPSRPLWDHLPLLPFTQFPWRFLSVQAFAAALATAALAQLPARRLVVLLAGGLLIASSLGRLTTDHLLLADADVTAENLAQYEWFTGNIGSTVSAEYLPPTVQPRPYTSNWLKTGSRTAITCLAGEVTASEAVSLRTTRQTWRITAAGAGATIRFPTLFWPGWKGQVDGEAVEIRPSPGSGLIMLALPPGSHTVTLYLARTPIRLMAELLSLAAFLIVGRLLWPYGAWRRLLLILAAILVVATVAYLWPPRALPAGNLTWDFAQMGYLHHDEGGALFDNGWRLAHYEYSRETAAAGQTFTITLQWQKETGAPATTGTVALFTPAANRPRAGQPLPPALVGETAVLQVGETVYSFTVPANAPAGLYVPRLVLDDGRPLMPSGRRRGDLFLRPLRIGNQEETAAGDTPALAVRPVRVEREDGALAIQLAWLTRDALNRNYNVSLRLLGENGRELVQLDNQPGYGFQPSSGWPAGQWVNDWLSLSLPTAETPPYVLVARLYDVVTADAVLMRRLGQLEGAGDALVFQPNRPNFTLPATLTPLFAQFANEAGALIQLHGYALAQNDGTLSLTLYWEALAPMQKDYLRFVHLTTPQEAQPVAQRDGMPRNNSYPTGQWAVGEIVADTVVFNLDEMAAGKYRIALGFYLNEGDLPRLTAVDADNIPYPAGRVLLPPTIENEP